MDGTFNGEKLIASDYWFSVELGDGRVLKAIFLKDDSSMI
jgi:gliding motility-associated-like protein